MAKQSSPFFKIGYVLYTKTPLGKLYFDREVSKSNAKYQLEGHSQCETYNSNGLKITPIAMAMDNYGYLIQEPGGTAVLVDPADVRRVQAILQAEDIKPVAILTTHKHWDHSGGNKDLKRKYPDIRIYGGHSDNVPCCTHTVSDDDKITLGPMNFMAHMTPGHTVGHTVYILDGRPFGSPACLFSGDHLFIGGIGRMFECSSHTMLKSIDKVNAMTDDTLVWPGHEYAADNLDFALSIDPDNDALKEKNRWVCERRKDKHQTCPSTLGDEKMYNPFLRCRDDSLLQLLGIDMNNVQGETLRENLFAQALAELRSRKDKFKYKP